MIRLSPLGSLPSAGLYQLTPSCYKEQMRTLSLILHSSSKLTDGMAPSSTQTLNGTTEVIQLMDLITASVKEVVNEYQAAGHVIPSIFSTDSGPFDLPHLASANLTKAIQIIEAACAQLVYTVASPAHTITNVFTQLNHRVQ